MFLLIDVIVWDIKIVKTASTDTKAVCATND